MAKTVGLIFPIPEKTRLQCPYCDKTYANEENLTQHIKEKHSDETTSDQEE